MGNIGKKVLADPALAKAIYAILPLPNSGPMAGAIWTAVAACCQAKAATTNWTSRFAPVDADKLRYGLFVQGRLS